MKSLIRSLFPGASTVAPQQSAASPKAERTAQEAWHDRLAPRVQLADAFEKDGVLRDLPKADRVALRDLAAPLFGQLDDKGRRTLLAYMANDEALLRQETSPGFSGVKAAGVMWSLLYAETAKPKTAGEAKAFETILRAYKYFFLSALVNHYYRKHSEKDPRDHAGAQTAIVAAGLSPTHSAILQSGFVMHATLTRVAMLSPENNDTHPTGSTMATYQSRVSDALGRRAPAWLVRSYQLGMDDGTLRSPVVQSLITQHHALIHPASNPQEARVTWREKNGNTKKATVALTDIEAFLQKRELRPVGNGFKATVHNGGSGARFNFDNARPYDYRLLVPLAQAPGVLEKMQSTKLGDKANALRVFSEIANYDANAVSSMKRAPAMQLQELGNCTIHSQKMCLVYELQHLREFGDNEALSGREGVAAFARLWTRGFERVRRCCVDTSLRNAARKVGENLAVEMALLQMDPQERAKLKAAHAPQAQAAAIKPRAKATRTSPRATRAPNSKPANQARLTAPTLEPVALPPEPPRIEAPASLSRYGVQGGGQPPDKELLAWFYSIRGTPWAPRQAAELLGYDALLAHVQAQSPEKAGRSSSTESWVNGRKYLNRGFAATEAFLKGPDAKHPAMKAVEDMAFFYARDKAMEVYALPLHVYGALAEARRHNSRLRQLLEPFKAHLDQFAPPDDSAARLLATFGEA